MLAVVTFFVDYNCYITTSEDVVQWSIVNQASPGIEHAGKGCKGRIDRREHECFPPLWTDFFPALCYNSD